MINKETFDEEILMEIASVGGQYGRKIEYYMNEIKRILNAINYLQGRMRREKKIPKFTIRLISSLRRRLNLYKREALKYRYYLIIYRESIGLTNHRIVYEIYNIESLFENGKRKVT